MVLYARKSVLFGCLLLCSASAIAQSVNSVDQEPAVIVEIGAAAGRSLTGGGSSAGPNLAVEVTPIENALELELGVTTLFGRHSTEWSADLLFKKPWTLSDKAEVMAGVGPEWIHASEDGKTTNSPGATVALDFMFWPSGKHKFGWFLEPAYDYGFGARHEQSLGVSFGLLIGIGTRPSKTKAASTP